MITIIGIDPGTANPGAVALEQGPYGWTALDVPALADLNELTEWCCRMLRNPPPNLQLVAVEQVSTSVIWGKSGYGSADIIECVGMARTMAKFLSVPFIIVNPKTMRKATLGSGTGKKDDMRRIIEAHVRLWPKHSSLNQSDAAAVALGAYRMGQGPAGQEKRIRELARQNRG